MSVTSGGRYVGRVGALAVALGIGAAIVTPGVARADEPDTSNSASSADRGSAAGSTGQAHGTGKSNPSQRRKTKVAAVAGDSAETPARHRATVTVQAPATEPDAPAPTDRDRADKTRRGKVARIARPDVSSAPDAGPAEVADRSTNSTVPVADRAVVSVPATPAPAPTAAVDLVQATAPVARSAVAPVAAATEGRALVAGPTPDSQSTGGPVLPVQSSTLTGLLGLISRDLEYTLFNHGPKVSYDSSLNHQSAAGQVLGQLDGTDADGDALTYTVVWAPRSGSVSVAPDGAFTYTPYSEFATVGGTDSFLVKTSDFVDNPLHVHAFAPFGASAFTKVTVQVAPTGAISPLGTGDQLDAEALATRIVNTPLVKLAKVILKMAWRAAAVKQFAAVGGPDAANLAALDQAVDEFALQAALEYQLLNPNDPHVLQQVMPPHTWFGQSFGGARIFYDNPDTIYRMIPVNNASAYVLTGRFDGPMPAETTFSVLTGLTGTTTSVIFGKDLQFNPDGSFTITLDSTPAAGRPNHLQLPSGATLIAARNTLSDWGTQVPMSLSVQRVSGPPNNLFSQLGAYDIPLLGPILSGTPILSQLLALVPPLRPAPLLLQSAETAIVMALGLFMGPQYMAVATTDPDTGQLRAPNTLSDPSHNASFLATQLQSAGYFQLADNEALVIKVNPGSAGYFSVPVTNDWTITDNYWDQQTSLNIGQAVRNDDGSYTVVVSPTEPCTAGGCLANWVSTGGLHQGTLSIRFQDIDTNPQTYVAPTVDYQLVTLDQLASVLPPETVYLSAAQRAAVLADRKAAYNRRYAPFPQV